MEGLLSSLIAIIPAGNVVPLFIIRIINTISISFALFERKNLPHHHKEPLPGLCPRVTLRIWSGSDKRFALL